jgi:hypothetical protein
VSFLSRFTMLSNNMYNITYFHILREDNEGVDMLGNDGINLPQGMLRKNVLFFSFNHNLYPTLVPSFPCQS